MKRASILLKICLFAALLCMLSSIASYYAVRSVAQDNLRGWTEDTQLLTLQAIRSAIEQTLSEATAITAQVRQMDTFQALSGNPITSGFPLARERLRLSDQISAAFPREHSIAALVIAFPWGSQLIPGIDIISANTGESYRPYRDFQALASRHSTLSDAESVYTYTLSDASSSETRRIGITAATFPPFQDEVSAFITVIMDVRNMCVSTDATASIAITDGAGNRFDILADGAGEPRAASLRLNGWTLNCDFVGQPEPDSMLPLLALSTAAYAVAGYLLTRRVASRRFSVLADLEAQLSAYHTTGSTGGTQHAPLQRQPFGRWLILWYAVITITPMILSALLLSLSSGATIQESVINAYRHSANLIGQQIEHELDAYQAVLEACSLDATIQDTLVTGTFDESDTAALELEVLRLSNTSEMLQNLILIRNEQAYALAGRNAFPSTVDHQLIEDHSFLMDHYGERPARFIPLAVEGEGLIRMGILSIGSHTGEPHLGQRLGTVWLDFSDANIRALLDTFAASNLPYAFRNNTGALIMGAGFDQPTFAPLHTALYRNWTLEILVSPTTISAQINSFLSHIARMLLILYAALMGFVLLIQRHLTRSIYRLLLVMDSAQHGDLSVRYEGKGDEFDRLGFQFNEMLIKLDAAVSDKLDYEKRMHAFEINLLQAQVHPHFLYNTLRTVQVLIAQNNPRAIDIIDKLIRLFRASANLHTKEISLGQELDNLHAYLDIQMLRFSDKFAYQEFVPQKLRDRKIIRFVLQPLVENAINHGLRDKQANGLIQLTAEEHNGILLISICDNGDVILEDQLNDLRHKLDESKFDSHIGLLNVHHRVRLQYSEGFGLTLSKSDLGGLRVELRFPALHTSE